MTAGTMTLVLLVVIVATYASWIVGRGRTLSDHLLALGDSVAESSFGPTNSTNGELVDSLKKLHDQASKLDQDLWPLRVTSAMVGFIPYVGDSMKVGPNVTERVMLDLEATIALLDVANDISSMVEEVGVNQGGIEGVISQFNSDGVLESSSELLDEAAEKLQRSQQLSAEISPSRVPGSVSSKLLLFQQRETQLLETVIWTDLTVESLKALAAVGSASAPLLGLSADPDAKFAAMSISSTEIAILNEKLATTARYLKRARETVPGEIAGTEIESDLIDLAVIVMALVDTLNAVENIIAAIEPAVDQITDSDGGLFGEQSMLLSGIESLAELDPTLAEAELVLNRAIQTLRSHEFSRRAIDTAAMELRDGASSISGILNLLRTSHILAPDALGKSTTKRYLVLGLTADELRGSGGFVSAVWVLSFRNGNIWENQYYDSVRIDSRHDLSKYPTPPLLLQQNMDTHTWLTRDVAWDPDFPSVATQAIEFWENGENRKPLDGVIAINQRALVDMVAAFGSIDIEGNSIPADLVMNDLEEGTDEEGRIYTDKIFNAIQERIMSKMTRSDTLRVAIALHDILKRKSLMLNFTDAELQSFATTAGWSGDVNFGSGDRLAIVDSNVGWNKVDRNISRSTEYTVKLSESGFSTAITTVKYQNLSGSDARGCQEQARAEGEPYRNLLNGCYWNALRVYLPSQASLIESSALALPQNSVAHLAGFALPGQITTEIGYDTGGVFVSGLLAIPPGETRIFTIETEVPDLISQNGDNSATYELNVFAQPGVISRNTAISVVLPPNYAYKTSSVVPTSYDDRSVRFEFSLFSDTEIVIELIRHP